MEIEPLQAPQANAYYDGEEQLVYVSYRGALTAQQAEKVYTWLGYLHERIDLATTRGAIFDFSAVTAFDEGNLQAARKLSKQMNMRVNTRHLPIALVVSDFYQEEILRATMRITSQHTRRQTFWSEEEALAFVRQWHAADLPEA